MPAASAASTMRRQEALVVDIGFCSRTCLPARAARTASSSCVSSGVVMMTGVLSTVQTTVGPRELPAAFAALGMIAAVAQAAGILLAGLAGIPGLLLPLLDLQAGLYLAAAAVGLVWMSRGAAPTGVRRPARRSRR